jgi:hypothetical protein
MCPTATGRVNNAQIVKTSGNEIDKGPDGNARK